MSNPVRILIVEDLVSDFELAQFEIRKSVKACVFERAESREGFLHALESFQPDVILSDYSLPSFDGLSALKLTKAHAALTPFIIWTGSLSEDIAVECMRAGANDYVLKENIKRLGPAIVHSLEERQSLIERRKSEAALLEAEQKYRALVEQSPVVVYEDEAEGSWRYLSPQLEQVLGYTPEEFIRERDLWRSIVHPDDLPRITSDLQAGIAARQRVVMEFRVTTRDGRLVWLHDEFEPIRDVETGKVILHGVFYDITARKQAEIEIQQRSDDLQLINAINKAVIRGEDLDGVVNLLSKELKRIFSVSGSTIYMLSPDGNSLMMQQYNLAPETTRHIEKVIGSTIPLVHIPIQEGGFFQKALMSQTGMVTSDPEQIMKWMEEFVETSFIPSIARGTIRKLIPQIFKFLNITSTITVPLILEGKAIGLLDVSSTEMFTENDLKRIENISRQLTAAIQRQQSIAQVQRSQAFLQSVQDALSASIAILDEQGAIVQVNSAWRKFGEQNGLRHPEYCIGLNYLDICDATVGPDSGEARLASKGIRDVITGQKREVEVEYPCHSPEEQRWFSLRITKFDDGEHVWVVLAHENITARKQAEEAFRETSEQFQTLFEASPDAILLIEPRDEWHIVGCNNAACQMNGYTRDELIGQSIGMLNLSPGSPAERSKYLEKIRASNILRYEDKHRRKDGTIFPIEVSTSLITVGGREMVLGIDRDITERKQAEAALRDSEEKYRLLFESNPLPMWIYDLETLRFLKVNDAAVNHYGYSEDEFMAMTIKDIRPATDIPRLLENISHIDQGIDNAGLWNHNKKDGSIIQVEIISHLVEFNGRRAELVLANDATERIQTQTKISELLAFNEKLLNNSPVGILAYKQTGECIFANQTAASIVGSDFERLRAQNYHELESWKTSGLYDLAENAMKTSDALVSDIHIATTFGRNAWLTAHCVKFRQNEEDNLLLLLSDVTQRKQAEAAEREQRTLAEALRDTAETLNSTLEYGDVLDHILATVGKVVAHDAASIMLIHQDVARVARMQGYAERGLDIEIAKYEFSLAETVNLRQMLETRQPLVISDTHSFPGWQLLPNTTWLRSNVGAPISISGEVVGFILLDSGTANFFAPVHAERLQAFASQAAIAIQNARLLKQAQEEIAERKQAEEELRQSESRYRTVVENQTEFIVHWKANGVRTFVNDAYCRYYGLTFGEALTSDFLSLVHPADRPAIEKKISRLLSGKIQAETDVHRVIKPDGSIGWQEWTDSAIYDKDGQVIEFQSIGRDITERKQAEENTTRHLAEMQALYENGLAVARLLNPREIGEHIIATFARYLSWHHVAIRLLKPGTDNLELIAFNQAGLSEGERSEIEYRFQSMINKVGQGLSGWVVGTGVPLRTGNVHLQPQYVDTHSGIQSGLYMPLKAGDRIIGVISVESEQADAFTLQDEHLLATLATQAAIAFENARLYHTNRQERERFSDLFENSPIATWLEDFSAVISWMDDLKMQGVTDLREYLVKNPQQCTFGVSLIHILDVNHAAVVMNGARNKEELIEKVYELMVEDVPSQVMINELDLIWKGYTSFGFEMSSRKLDGSIVTGIQRVYIPSNNNVPDYSRVIVTSTDITERMNVDKQLRASEVHYRELTDSITDIFFELDQDLRYTHWNKASEMLTGLSAEYAIGKSMQEVFGINEEQTRIEKIYKNILDTHQPRSFEATLSVNDQSRTFEFNAYPSTRGLAAVAKDVTERKLSESLMQKRFELMEYSASHGLEELMQKALDEISEWTHSAIGFFQLIKEDQVTSSLQVWSTDTFKHFHSSRMEEMHKPADQAGLWAEAVRQRRAVIHNDFESLSGKKGLPEGHASVIRELVLPIIRNEKIVAVIGIGNKAQDYTRGDLELTERFADYAWDVIERKQMVIEIAEERNLLAKRVEERTSDLSRANSNLARALRVKDEFLANMSHELRTPLNAILGLSESLGEQTAGPLNEKQQKYLNTISESGHHLLSLINDILDLAKIEAGQITLDVNKVDVNSVSQASLRMVRQLAQKKNLEVSVEIDTKLGLMWADERRLKQMIVNLLSNAVKFTPEGGRIGLQVSGDQEENKVSFTVWDTGIGIKQSDFERLFQPFMQLDSGLARESSGTGLGLALVSQMARLHGGSISVNSEAGKGSRFTIVLPWEPALAPDMVERMKVTGKFRTIQPGQPRQTILLVEDTQEVVMMIKDYLEIAGYKVATAQDGLDGLTQAKFTHPDLILMDVQMPRMDGLEATKTLRLDPEFKYTPIIALTALAMPNDRERCIAAGMDEYISKPVNLRGLVKLIQNYLSLREENPKPR